MTKYPLSILQAVFLMAGLLLVAGCKREAGPPPPLSAEALPGELAKAFDKGTPEMKQVVDGVKAAMESKDYVAAYQAIQYLANAPDATDDQRKMVARAMVTLTGLLQTAGNQGDSKAADALKNYRINK